MVYDHGIWTAQASGLRLDKDRPRCQSESKLGLMTSVRSICSIRVEVVGSWGRCFAWAEKSEDGVVVKVGAYPECPMPRGIAIACLARLISQPSSAAPECLRRLIPPCPHRLVQRRVRRCLPCLTLGVVPPREAPIGRRWGRDKGRFLGTQRRVSVAIQGELY